MRRRVLVLGAGTGTGNNLIRSLRSATEPLFIAGCHADRFILKNSAADSNYLMPGPASSEFLPALRDLIEDQRIDLLIPNTDADVATIAHLREKFACRIFLPSLEMIALCQDKFRLTEFLRTNDIAAPETCPVTTIDGVDDIFERFARPLLWCRIRKGNGSMGAVPVRDAAQAKSWIRYWEDMRRVPATSFTISEYLPGRDFSLQCLWSDGTVVALRMAERLTYFGGASGPSGTSSTPALAKTVFEPDVVNECMRAILAIDRHASGIFCFDVKEDVRGRPCITEINAGRFAMITNLYDLIGSSNMASLYVRLAMGDAVDVKDPYEFPGEYYLVRDLDSTPLILRRDQLFEGISLPPAWPVSEPSLGR